MTFIETPRLILRPPEIKDLDAIQSAKLAVWPELQNWMSWACDEQKNIECTRDFIENFSGALCGFCKDTGEFVISSGFHPTSNEGEFEVGYWVAGTFLGKGYATEATNAILRYMFEAKNARIAHTCYYEGNEKSRNVMTKLGFEFALTKPKAHRQFSTGVLLDEHRYIRHNALNLPELEVTWR